MDYNTRGQEIAQQLLRRHTWRTFWTCPWDLSISMKNNFLVQAKLLVLGLLSLSAGLTGFPNYWISNQRNCAAHWWWSTHFLPCCILFFQLWNQKPHYSTCAMHSPLTATAHSKCTSHTKAPHCLHIRDGQNPHLQHEGLQSNNTYKCYVNKVNIIFK